jgi:hypothetical protein
MASCIGEHVVEAWLIQFEVLHAKRSLVHLANYVGHCFGPAAQANAKCSLCSRAHVAKSSEHSLGSV